MAARASDWLMQQILEEWVRGQAVTVPTSLWLALYTGDPLPDDSGPEVSGSAYARIEIPCNASNWAAVGALGTGWSTTNLLGKTFPAPSGGNWGTVTHWGLHNAVTAGQLVIYGDMATARVILVGDPAPTVPASALVLSLTPPAE